MAHSVVRGLSFYYVEAGEGRPLVLLHPAPFDHRVWLYQLLPLSGDFRVIAIDQRCFGRSSKPETPFSMAAYAEDLAGILDGLGIEAIDVIGLSLGGIVAQLLALDYPKRVRRMVLVSTTASTVRARYLRDRMQGFQSQGIAAYCREAIETFFRPEFRASALGQSLIESFAGHTPWLTLPSLIRFYEALSDVDITSRLQDIRVPALVVVGSEDFTLDQSQQLAAGIPGAKLAVIPETGRCVPVEAPGQFNRLVKEFLLEGGSR